MSVIRYNSLREIMQADLARLPDKIKEGALEAINDAADFMVILAKGYVLVDTGTLQKSIRKEQSGNIIRVIAGGYQFINPKTNRPCTYAVYVEAKNPFMKPAWEAVKRFITQKIREKVLQKIE